jgi:hypothetical protein
MTLRLEHNEAAANPVKKTEFTFVGRVQLRQTSAGQNRRLTFIERTFATVYEVRRRHRGRRQEGQASSPSRRLILQAVTKIRR